MAETKVTAATMTQGAVSEQSNGKTRDNTPMKLYLTKEECLKEVPEKVRIANEKKEGTWKPICVTRPDSFDGDKQVWLWAVGHVNALAVVSGMDGYTASTGERGPRKPADKAAAALDAYQHFTETQMKDAGFPQPLIEAILASRKVAADANPLNTAKAAKEAEQKAAGKGKKS